MKRRSFFWQILPWIFGLSLILGPLSSYLSYRHAQKILLKQIEQALLVQTKSLVPLLLDRFEKNSHEGLRDVLKKSSVDKIRYSVIALDGTVLADTDIEKENIENHADRIEFKLALKDNVGTSWRYSNSVHQHLYYVAVPLKLDGQIFAVLRLATQVKQIEALMDDLVAESIRACLLALVASFLIGIFMARHLASPLEDVIVQLAAVSGDLESVDLKIRPNYSREIKNLVENINRLATSLQIRRAKSRKQESELQSIFMSLTEGIVTVDAHKNIFHFNQRFLEMFELSPIHFKKGMPLEEAIPSSILQEMISTVLERRELLEKQWNFSRPHESAIEFSHVFNLKATPIWTQSGELMGVLVVVNDHTEMKKLENHRKEFVANVGHELRTPLTAIQGYLETLSEGKVDDPELVTKFIQKSLKQSIRLARLVDDLFRLAQIEADNFVQEIEKKSCLVSGIMGEAVEAVTGKAQGRKISIQRRPMRPDMTCTVHAGLIELALVNLLDNAIKYSPAGSSVFISAGQDKHRTYLRVEDQGPGIDPVHRPRIFERFYCIDKARSREMGGTGLGLSLVKHIALLHGGDVEVGQSPVGGAQFTLWLQS